MGMQKLLLCLSRENHKVSKRIVSWLEKQGELVIRRAGEIVLKDVQSIGPDWIISYNYKYLFDKSVINYMQGKAINLHIGYLPYNRGYHPNVWSFLDRYP